MPLADELLSRYLNPLQASIYAEELSAQLIAVHDQAPHGMFHERLPANGKSGGNTTSELADRFMEERADAVKAFMFDKLWGEST